LKKRSQLFDVVKDTNTYNTHKDKKSLIFMPIVQKKIHKMKFSMAAGHQLGTKQSKI
jgi:hypothetical protein